jgi:PAS domain-containing protein
MSGDDSEPSSKGIDGTITSWNANAERSFGFTAEGMVEENIRRLIPEEPQAEEDEILAHLRASRSLLDVAERAQPQFALITEAAEALLGAGRLREGP